MPNSFTANLNLELPQVGADGNLWGGHLNSDFTIVDGIFTATSTRPVSVILKSDTSIIDATVTTKAIMFALSGITAATTRNLTVQDADGTLAYTAQVAASTVGLGNVTTGQLAASTIGMVTVTDSQTLTNKTIDAAANTISNIDLTADVTGVLPRANGGFTPAQITASLGSDVALNNMSNYFDGPSVAQGTSGTWFAFGTVTVTNPSGSDGAVNLKLWDGTSVIASSSVSIPSASSYHCVALSGFIVSPAGNIRISGRDPGSTSGIIAFNQSGNSKDSTITVIRIA